MRVELLGIHMPFLQSTGSPEQLIELAGRTCYQSQDKITPESSREFVKRVVKLGHLSVLEHSYATFRISECSRAMTHQLVRHRLIAASQESQRYCDEEGMYKQGYFVTPKAVRDLVYAPVEKLVLGATTAVGETVGEWYDGCIKQIDEMYQDLQALIRAGREKGLTRAKTNEDARFLLPNACMSQIVISANFRELRHIFRVRCSKHAQWEIRAVAVAMLRIMKEEAPAVFGDFEIYHEKDGTKTAVTEEGE